VALLVIIPAVLVFSLLLIRMYRPVTRAAEAAPL
jgi:hypothetical protein